MCTCDSAKALRWAVRIGWRWGRREGAVGAGVGVGVGVGVSLWAGLGLPGVSNNS